MLAAFLSASQGPDHICSVLCCALLLLQDAARIMPGIDVTSMLRSNPDMILSLQKGKNLIPYDQLDNPWS
jgi:hypothetical protein